MHYAAFFDLSLHYVGPFDTVEACNAHAAAVRELGDGAEYRGTVLVANEEPDVDVSSPTADLELIRATHE